jgi:hypothetical protein
MSTAGTDRYLTEWSFETVVYGAEGKPILFTDTDVAQRVRWHCDKLDLNAEWNRDFSVVRVCDAPPSHECEHALRKGIVALCCRSS